MATNDPHEPDLGGEMPFLQHLVELRDRLLRVVLTVTVVFLAIFPFANDLYSILAEPLLRHLPEGTSMIATEVASPFLTPFKLSLVAAVFLVMPYILYQVWAFVAPGLYQHERRLAMPVLLSSIVLFYTGMLFAYYVVFPLVFAFLTGTAPEGVAVMTDIARYLDFVLTLFFAFGIAFEVPIATFILVWMGVTTPENLASKRPYIIVGAFLIGMLLTPPDIISQTLLAIPMWVLFELGVFFAKAFVRRSSEAEESDSPASTPSLATASAAPAFDGDAGADPDPGPKTGADQDGFRPLTEEEMDAELDQIEEQELADETDGLADASDDWGEDEADESDLDPVADKLRRVQHRRDAGDQEGARELLYEILAEGNDDQVNVARNILAQMDR